MSHHKLVRTEADADLYESRIKAIIAKGPSKSAWWDVGDFRRDVIQPRRAAFNIENNFDMIKGFEIIADGRDDSFYSLYPQWMWWFKDHLSGQTSGKRFRDLRESARGWYTNSKRQQQSKADKDKLIAILIDSTAMLPTNVTIFRLSYYMGDGAANRRAKLRFLTGYALGLQSGYIESHALQLGVVAALPRNIENKDDHKALWSDGNPPNKLYQIESDEYVPLEVIFDTTSGIHFGEFEIDGKYAI